VAGELKIDHHAEAGEQLELSFPERIGRGVVQAMMLKHWESPGL
jgi:hypothetical protein